ncbi:MAG: HD domain-containing protein [Alphaproteobacteria bacterium]|nr:HD domain-containing protein [Alphaproteobacteria bacterium]
MRQKSTKTTSPSESLVKAIRRATRKSPYTSGHCQRVPVLADMIADAACAADWGPFAGFDLTGEERYEIHLAAWMHDCGKVTTSEYVMDKSTKLETIYDRIETVRTRFTLLQRDAEIDYLKKQIANQGSEAERKAALDARLKQIDEDRAFIEQTNVGGEFLADEKIERIKKVGAQRWRDWTGADKPFLSDNEIYNLSIRKGTLTTEERKIISDHVVVTIEMLEQLPFPKNLARVPEYAGGHHERMDGKGYPKGLKKEDMSIPARIMAIADIYEALTAADRPYKKEMTLLQSLKIMKKMQAEGHIDADLFKLFVEAGVYRRYAEAHLKPEQLDTVDERELLSV